MLHFGQVNNFGQKPAQMPGRNVLLFVELDDLIHMREINAHASKRRRKVSLIWTSATGNPWFPAAARRRRMRGSGENKDKASEHTSKLEPPENGTIARGEGHYQPPQKTP
jgi:hypothetical protein